MTDTTSIRKINPPHPGMDFGQLRREGIERIIALSSDIWTDYNVHDPGITFLEVLCYAITDLSYRSNLPMEDLLAEHSGSTPPPGLPTATEVLVCNPVTALDWRKLIIDIDGVKNAWVYKAEKVEPQFGISDSTKAPIIDFSKKTIPLNGLLHILIDLDDNIPLANKPRIKDQIINLVRERLHAYRNLCEDFVSIEVVPPLDVQLCAALEIDEESNPHAIMAELQFRIQEFLSPTPRFLGLEEMLQRRGTRSFEEIFAGPVLENGFLDAENLKATELRTQVNASDLATLIHSIPGVKKLWGVKIKNGDVWTEGKLPIKGKKKPLLDIANSSIELRRRGQEVDIDEAEVATIRERLQWEKRPLSARARMSIPYPNATARPDLTDYFSIQNDLPHAYHVDTYGLEDSAPVTHHAQVRQLKAFLLVFDQILANYLVHLSQVKELLRIDQSHDAPTLFSHLLYEEVANIGLALVGFKDGKSQPYETFLQNGLETPDQITRQRNQILEHLTARFGEVFTDFALMVFFDDPRTGWTETDYALRLERKLSEKTEFLQHIPRLSRERGKGFNYLQKKPNGAPDVWNTDNVEGLKSRVCKLLGISPVKRETITCPPTFTIEFSKTGKQHVFLLKSTTEKKAALLLQGTQPTEKRIKESAKALVDALGRVENFPQTVKTYFNNNKTQGELSESISKKINELFEPSTGKKTNFTLEPHQQKTYHLCVLDKDRKIIARSYASLKKVGELQELLLKLEAMILNQDCETAGFHIVEHILLRPKFENCCTDHPALILKKKEGEETPKLISDPYSFWITIVAANTWKRYQHPSNRQVFEQTLRKETPAHIGVRICWVSNEELYQFEIAYGRWLTELNNPKPDRCDLDGYAKELTEVLNSLDQLVCCGQDELSNFSLPC